MQQIMVIDNLTKEPIRLEVDVEWDMGPYVSIVGYNTDGEVVIDLSVSEVVSWNEMSTKIAEKFLEILDTGRSSN